MICSTLTACHIPTFTLCNGTWWMVRRLSSLHIYVLCGHGHEGKTMSQWLCHAHFLPITYKSEFLLRNLDVSAHAQVILYGQNLILWLSMQIFVTPVSHTKYRNSLQVMICNCAWMLQFFLQLADSSWIVFVTNWTCSLPLMTALKHMTLWELIFVSIITEPLNILPPSVPSNEEFNHKICCWYVKNCKSNKVRSYDMSKQNLESLPHRSQYVCLHEWLIISASYTVITDETSTIFMVLVHFLLIWTLCILIF
jgi:hypothetical protein